MRTFAMAAILAAGLPFGHAAQAASLRVAPVLIDLSAPTAASSIRIWNDAPQAINVQTRIFRWSQKNGVDVYTPATDVVASPPITKLKPGGENMVRIVRTSKKSVQSEESYRLLVDELPNAGGRKAGTVVLVVRHSIPVFFSRPDAAEATTRWQVTAKAGGYQLTAVNSGARRLKISNLSLSAGSKSVAQRDGLIGYVLGKSTVSWFIPAQGGKRASGSSLTITADSEAGRFNATASLNGG